MSWFFLTQSWNWFKNLDQIFVRWWNLLVFGKAKFERIYFFPSWFSLQKKCESRILFPKLTFCEKKNCSSDREKLFKFETEGRSFAKILRSLEQFFEQNIFWNLISCSQKQMNSIILKTLLWNRSQLSILLLLPNYATTT